MKEELAVDKLRQQQIQNDLNLPKFNQEEKVEVDEDDVSDDISNLPSDDGDE